MGRSAVDYLSAVIPHEDLSDKILLIGSKESQLAINGLVFNILEPSSGFSRIRKNALFFNAAFLRREILQTISNDE